jgi:hypothetical protein
MLIRIAGLTLHPLWDRQHSDRREVNAIAWKSGDRREISAAIQRCDPHRPDPKI